MFKQLVVINNLWSSLLIVQGERVVHSPKIMGCFRWFLIMARVLANKSVEMANFVSQ